MNRLDLREPNILVTAACCVLYKFKRPWGKWHGAGKRGREERLILSNLTWAISFISRSVLSVGLKIGVDTCKAVPTEDKFYQ